jgi:NADH dehydrogenase (ubiquinone) 1 alpha subcomplex subunit 13
VLDEKHNARAILVPFLQAEEDRRYVRDFRELKERENTVMKNVRGWNPEEKTYKTTWLSPGAATRPGLI